METITLPVVVSSIVGVFTPLAIQWIKQYVASKPLRFIIALVLSGVVGVIGALVVGAEPSWQNITTFATISFGMSQIVFNGFKSLTA